MPAPAFVPAEKKSPLPRVPEKTESSNRISHEPKVTDPQLPPADDDFARQYANFDEASVAEVVSTPTESPAQRAVAPKTPTVNISAVLSAAKENVPENVRTYLAERFQVEFSRYVPAGEAQFFSIFGDVTSGTNSESEADDTTPLEDEEM